MLNQLRQQVERKMLGLLMICHVRAYAMIFMRELDVLRIHAYKLYSLKITYYVCFGDVNHVYFDSVCV